MLCRSVQGCPASVMIDSIVAILVALVKIFPDLLDALKPDHAITKRVTAVLPSKSKSKEVAEKLAGK